MEDYAMFAAALLGAAAFVLVPGYLLGRAARLDRASSVAVAPVLATVAYGVAGVVLQKAGAVLAPAAFVGIVVALAALNWAVATLVRRRRGKEKGSAKGTRKAGGDADALGADAATVPAGIPASASAARAVDASAVPGSAVRASGSPAPQASSARSHGPAHAGCFQETPPPSAAPCANPARRLSLVGEAEARTLPKLLLLYQVIGLIMGAVYFLGSLDTPLSFGRFGDNASHFGFIRGFLELGEYSVLGVTPFPELGDPGSYPAAFHILAACAAGVTGVPEMVAVNATMFLLIAVVLPLGQCLLLANLFAGRRPVIVAGSLCTLAFAAFPWDFLIFGQLMANLYGFALVPAVAALLVRPADAGLTRGERALLGGLLVVGFGALALAQPNAAFTTAILGVPYLMSRTCQVIGQSGRFRAKRRAQTLALAAILLAACGLWALFFLAPFMQGVVTYHWDAIYHPLEALAHAVLLSFTRQASPQPVMALFVLAGLWAALRDGRSRWLLAVYAAGLAIYVASASAGNALGSLLSGFWYTDPYRTGAQLALFAVPLAALGMGWAAHALAGLAMRVRKGLAARRPAVQRVALALVMAALLAGNSLVPAFPVPGHGMVPNGLACFQEFFRAGTEWDTADRSLNATQYDFARRAMELVPQGERVLNMGCDGSAWLYGLEGYDLNARLFSITGMVDANPLLREKLNELATNKDVQQAVRDSGAGYVLRLLPTPHDPGFESRTMYLRGYTPERFAGMEAINDSTPGFTPVLSEGPMRLYQIDPAYTAAGAKPKTATDDVPYAKSRLAE